MQIFSGLKMLNESLVSCTVFVHSLILYKPAEKVKEANHLK